MKIEECYFVRELKFKKLNRFTKDIDSMYIKNMKKTFRWDIGKNEKLIKERGISFEMVSKAIEDGGLMDIIELPSRLNQQLLVVKIRDYVVLVPFVESENDIFLKTAYPSRKFKKKYLG